MYKYFNEKIQKILVKGFSGLFVFFLVFGFITFDTSFFKAALITFIVGIVCIFVYVLLSIISEKMYKKKLEIVKHEIKLKAIDFIEELIQQHIKILSRKKNQLIIYDDYGKEITTSWDNEKKYFFSEIVTSEIHKFYDNSLKQIFEKENLKYGEIKFDISFELIDQIIEDYLSTYKNTASSIEDNCSFSPDMDPYDYERYCTDLLIKNGWNARTTKASGDQGVDIIAEKENTTVVLQCKRYSQPVGNKAVQEVHAAKGFVQADYAVVVTNSSYTRSAKQLAVSLDVKLLHHSDLEDLEKFLF